MTNPGLISMKPAFRSITPLIPAGASLADALVFYVEQMGFSISWQNGGMAGIHRDAVELNLVVNDNREWADNASFRIGVSDLDALHREYRSIPAKVGPLEEKTWGLREFHVILPSGVCLQFFQRDSV